MDFESFAMGGLAAAAFIAALFVAYATGFEQGRKEALKEQQRTAEVAQP